MADEATLKILFEGGTETATDASGKTVLPRNPTPVTATTPAAYSLPVPLPVEIVAPIPLPTWEMGVASAGAGAGTTNITNANTTNIANAKNVTNVTNNNYYGASAPIPTPMPVVIMGPLPVPVRDFATQGGGGGGAGGGAGGGGGGKKSFDIFDALRGTLGGIFGPFTGAALDAGKALRDLNTGTITAKEAMTVFGVGVTVALASVSQAVAGFIRFMGSYRAALVNPSADVAANLDQMGQITSAVGSNVAGFGATMVGAGIALAPFTGGISLAVSAVGAAVFGVGAFTSALGASTEALAKEMKAFDGMAQRYGEFSPQIAVAEAMGEIKQTLGDLRRSQAIGPELTRYVNARTEIQQRLEDAKIKHLERMTDALIARMESEAKAQESKMKAEEFTAQLYDFAGQGLEIFKDIRKNTEKKPGADVEDPTLLVLRGYFEPGVGGGIRTPNE